ncbi:hypothetical protein D4L85_14595 [Chryseolinea soli]|uniref:Uncharacterized protein n=1 Tax=Chryseolinea soli TaxID=2321403 RepID=A0A385SML5_9BACT|nr:hypothetical protein D4L85_14595 [Chryseolinea soli]
MFSLITVSARNGHFDGEILTNGIFITPHDLATNRVSEQAETDDLNTVVNVDNNVLLIRHGLEQRYKFGTLSGYYKDGYRYRAFGKKNIFSASGYYKVLDAAGLIIYSKRSGHRKTGGKTYYYYSTGWDAPVRRLTRQNLEGDFSNDPVFVDAATSTLQGQVFLTEKNGRMLINDLYLSRKK